MKKILIVIIILLTVFGLEGQDTIWKDGAMYRTVTQYEKLISLSDSTKAKEAKKVLRASRIPIYDTVYEIDIKSLKSFLFLQKKGIVTERGIRVTDKKEFYEKTDRFVEWEEFNWWILIILPSLMLLSFVSLWIDKKFKEDSPRSPNALTIVLLPLMFLSLFFVVLFAIVFSFVYDSFLGKEFVRLIYILFFVFFILIMPLMRFFQKRRAKK